MTKLNIKQKTINFESGKETIISVNGCNIVYVSFCNKPQDGCLRNYKGFHVSSFAGDDNNRCVGKRYANFSEARSAGREFAKKLWPQHAAKHGL
ncbi:hypothetical protein NVP1081O_266 [Vibrio phage 1.081.O._10N.286.52.C2]|nr:hypothetical protein NVP1081O_266 [Vibrio phage 1.081.O._10N.286.52.C2]